MFNTKYKGTNTCAFIFKKMEVHFISEESIQYDDSCNVLL